jgi:hypothetical protein
LPSLRAVSERVLFSESVPRSIRRFEPDSTPSDTGPEGEFYVYALKRIHGGTERLAAVKQRVPAAGLPVSH